MSQQPPRSPYFTFDWWDLARFHSMLVDIGLYYNFGEISLDFNTFKSIFV